MNEHDAGSGLCAMLDTNFATPGYWITAHFPPLFGGFGTW
jgi:hypothetical protein